MRYHIMPGRNVVKNGVWPGNTPKSPSTPGIVTSSTSWEIDVSGETMCNVSLLGSAILRLRS
jgi:hypothetical protein